MTFGELFYRRACLIQEGYTNSLEFDAMFEADTDLGHAWCLELWRKRNRDFETIHRKEILESNERLVNLKPQLKEFFKAAGTRWNDPLPEGEVKIPQFKFYTASEIRERWAQKRKQQ